MPNATKTTDSPSTTGEKQQPYQDEFTENRMSSPEQREDVAHDLRLDPTTPDGAEDATRAGSSPRADGGEPDFDDEVAAESDDDEDDEDEDETK